MTNHNQVTQFTISKNNYLKHNIQAFYHQPYIGYNIEGNPDFLNHLKNTFDSYYDAYYKKYMDEVEEIIKNDFSYIITEILQKKGWDSCICVCVPRAKSFETYSSKQLLFSKSISNAINQMQVSSKAFIIEDGIDVICRHTNTKTTHLSKSSLENNGELPYPGITKNTCNINIEKIKNKNVILIDDIYTKSINIDEDCLQALIDCGVKDIVFYAVAKTGGGN